LWNSSSFGFQKSFEISDGLCKIGGQKHGLGFFFFLPCDCKSFEGMMEEEEGHLAAVAVGTCRAESESSPHHQEVREGIGGHYYWSSEELLFQELVTQLLLSSSVKQQQQLQGNNNSPPPRLGSGELVQLRKLFQETTRTTRLFKLLDVQVQEVKDLEAEMRELKLQGTTTEGRGGEGGGGGDNTTQTKAWNGSLMMMMRYSEDEEEEEDTAVEDDVVVGGAKDLETKMMQLGDMEREQQHGDDTRLEEAAAAESQKQQQEQNSGKRRTCFGVAISKFDVKKSRLDHLPSFTKPKPVLKEEETQ
jgi:hypothetical protein